MGKVDMMQGARLKQRGAGLMVSTGATEREREVKTSLIVLVVCDVVVTKC